MIRLITATPGSGKTCIVVEWLIREVDKGFYKEFYTNIDGLTICGVRPLPTDCDWRKLNPDKDPKQPPKLVIIDEAQYIDAFMKENRSVHNTIGKDLSTHRHYGIDIWLITQSTKLLNDYVLENVGEHVHLYRPRKRKSVTVYWWSYVQRSLTKSAFKDADDVQVWRLNPAMFDYYKSTSQVTDDKTRVSKKLFTSLITFFLMIVIIVYFVSRGLDFFTGASVDDLTANDKAVSIVNNSAIADNDDNKDDLQVADDLKIEKRNSDDLVLDEPKKDEPEDKPKDDLDEPKKDEPVLVQQKPFVNFDLPSQNQSIPLPFVVQQQLQFVENKLSVDTKPSMLFMNVLDESCFARNQSMQELDLTFDDCKNHLQNIRTD